MAGTGGLFVRGRWRGRGVAALGAAVLGLSAFAWQGALPVGASADPGVCAGTSTSPGVLAGHHHSVRVVGECLVNAGPASVDGSLTLTPGSVLLAAFALNDTTGTGHSSLSVSGRIRIQRGATMLLGCDPQSFPCLDDPNQANPTLSSHDRVGGSIDSSNPLGVVVHNASIQGSVDEDGGGGGFTCAPQGIFAAFSSPVYSDYEDSAVDGSVSVSGLTSCWLGFARLRVGESVSVNNDQLADPDAIEIVSNHIQDNLVCRGNSMTWDSAEAVFGQTTLYPRTPQPNTVAGHRSGQCVLASPATEAGPPGPGPF